MLVLCLCLCLCCAHAGVCLVSRGYIQQVHVVDQPSINDLVTNLYICDVSALPPSSAFVAVIDCVDACPAYASPCACIALRTRHPARAVL